MQSTEADLERLVTKEFEFRNNMNNDGNVMVIILMMVMIYPKETKTIFPH